VSSGGFHSYSSSSNSGGSNSGSGSETMRAREYVFSV